MCSQEEKVCHHISENLLVSCQLFSTGHISLSRALPCSQLLKIPQTPCYSVGPCSHSMQAVTAGVCSVRTQHSSSSFTAEGELKLFLGAFLGCKRCVPMRQCCPAAAPALLLAWSHSLKGWVLVSTGCGWTPSWPRDRQASPSANSWTGAGSLQCTCAAGLAVQGSTSQTRVPKLPCPTYPTVRWINERESLDREVLWVHSVGEEMFSFVSVQVVLLKPAKISFLTWVTAWIGWQGVNPFSAHVKRSVTVCQCTAFNFFFLSKFFLWPSS